MSNNAMTLEEAKALVLREGMMTEPNLGDAVPLMLHQGDSPASERMGCLIKAIDTVHEAIENDAKIDRKLAGALWIIGVEASYAIGKKWEPQEEKDIVALWEAVESALVGFWPVGHPRDKSEVTHGDGTAGKTGSKNSYRGGTGNTAGVSLDGGCFCESG